MSVRRTKGPYLIDRPDQLAALASPARQEVLDGVQAAGPCSIAQLAAHLGRPADSLYYHIRKLTDLGLLVEVGSRPAGPRPEAVYDVPGRPMRLRYRPADSANRRAVAKIVAGAVRLGDRDFRAALSLPGLVTEGPGRNVWGGRFKGWLSPEDLQEVNRHLTALGQLLTDSEPREGAQLHSLMFVLAPVAPKPARRTPAAKKAARKGGPR